MVPGRTLLRRDEEMKRKPRILAKGWWSDPRQRFNIEQWYVDSEEVAIVPLRDLEGKA